ncbi:hypothetical protein [Cellulosimicrobium sp. Marseille-Q4280]|uniref:hypothetical protein n=1 Tax=Cellulosimicrobium sp. Marseille-Q4280 TaxID=2937992 RepID=UPI00203BCBFA|nr:hypothetical protein [Cellulosimicrobium sp. Marseille-Q4280]
MSTHPGKARTPAGVREGGQFATTARAESSVSLAALSPSVVEAVRGDLMSRYSEAEGAVELAQERAAAAARTAAAAQSALDEAVAARDAAYRALEDSGLLVDGDLPPAPQAPVAEAVPAVPARPHDPTRVDEVVEVPGHGRFTRIEPGVPLDSDLGYLRVQVDRDLDPDEARQLAALVGYRWAATGGERIGYDVHQDSPNSIIVYADATKGRAYERLDAFISEVGDVVREGSKIRTTDRAGEGTKGTRLVEPLAGVGAVTLYQQAYS